MSHTGIIDLSWLVGRARAFIGQLVTGPIDFNDADFLACLDQETLPTLSIYLPWLENLLINVDQDMINNSQGIYQIRTNERIIGVNQIRAGGSVYGAFPYDPMLYGDMIDRQMSADWSSAAEICLTFKFSAPNVIEIFPKALAYSTISVECKLVHPTHLRTIPPGAREILRELFLADLATDVLSIRSYFQGMQSVFGELNLNLERLQAQADKRSDIVEKLESKQLKAGHTKRLWIA